jgi:hypothetical protein
VPSPDDTCKGGIDSVIVGGLLIDTRPSSDCVSKDGNDNSTPGIHRFNKDDNTLLIEEETEDVCVGSPRENRSTCISNNKNDNEDDFKILLRIQGADLEV